MASDPCFSGCSGVLIFSYSLSRLLSLFSIMLICIVGDQSPPLFILLGFWIGFLTYFPLSFQIVIWRRERYTGKEMKSVGWRILYFAYRVLQFFCYIFYKNNTCTHKFIISYIFNLSSNYGFLQSTLFESFNLDTKIGAC